jgi:hypothetical protein
VVLQQHLQSKLYKYTDGVWVVNAELDPNVEDEGPNVEDEGQFGHSHADSG